MQSLLQRVSFYLHRSLDVNKDKMIPGHPLRTYVPRVFILIAHVAGGRGEDAHMDHTR